MAWRVPTWWSHTKRKRFGLKASESCFGCPQGSWDQHRKKVMLASYFPFAWLHWRQIVSGILQLQTLISTCIVDQRKRANFRCAFVVTGQVIWVYTTGHWDLRPVYLNCLDLHVWGYIQSYFEHRGVETSGLELWSRRPRVTMAATTSCEEENRTKNEDGCWATAVNPSPSSVMYNHVLSLHVTIQLHATFTS